MQLAYAQAVPGRARIRGSNRRNELPGQGSKLSATQLAPRTADAAPAPASLVRCKDHHGHGFRNFRLPGRGAPKHTAKHDVTSAATDQTPERRALSPYLLTPPLAMVTATVLVVILFAAGLSGEHESHHDPGYLTSVLTDGWVDVAHSAKSEFVGPPAPTAIARATANTPSESATAQRAAHTQAVVADAIVHTAAGPRTDLITAQPQARLVLAQGSPEDEAPLEHNSPIHLPFDPLSEPSFTSTPGVAAAVQVSDEAAPEQAEELAAEADAAATASSKADTDTFQEFLSTQPDMQDARGLREVSHKIRSGETISLLLDSAGVSPAEVSAWLRAANQIYNVDRVYAGQAVSFLVDTRSRSLRHLALEIDRKSLLVANRTDGRIVAERREVPHFRRIRVAGGEIASSLYMAAITQGIPDSVISSMAEILGWEIDFARDVRPGATFRVAYEELVRLDTHESIAGRVLAVDVTNRGRSLEGIYFKPADGGRGGYYDRAGHALGRAFLRYPVEFSRISSHFTASRFHPVKKISLPHYGVDFAAPTGTPVVAAADGVVLTAAWVGGNGRLIKIGHDDVYESAYAHLSRIAPAVVEGARVTKGQVIGYVGSTGLATGPHLHYAMYEHGEYVDPLSTQLPRERSLSGMPLKAFEISLGMVDHAYAQAGFGVEEGAEVAAVFDEQP